MPAQVVGALRSERLCHIQDCYCARPESRVRMGDPIRPPSGRIEGTRLLSQRVRRWHVLHELGENRLGKNHWLLLAFHDISWKNLLRPHQLQRDEEPWDASAQH